MGAVGTEGATRRAVRVIRPIQRRKWIHSTDRKSRPTPCSPPGEHTLETAVESFREGAPRDVVQSRREP